MCRGIVVWFCVCASFAAAQYAHAETKTHALKSSGEDGTWKLYVEALNEVPLNVGVRLLAESPGRLRLGTSVGFLPDPYLDSINFIVVEAEVYNAQVADLIAVALKNSFLWKSYLGWRPVADLGSYVELQYTVMGLGGGLSDEELVVTATEAEVQDGTKLSREPNVSLDSTIHMIGVEAGYQWEFDSGLTLRTGLGFALTMKASFDVVVEGEGAQRAASRFNASLEEGTETYLKEVFIEWVHTPFVALSAGYRLF